MITASLARLMSFLPAELPPPESAMREVLPVTASLKVIWPRSALATPPSAYGVVALAC